MQNENDSASRTPPSHLITDFVEIGYLSTVFTCGTLFNGYTLWGMVRAHQNRYRNGRHTKETRLEANFRVMQMHLIACNLLILLVYCPTSIAWLLTYSWKAGGVMCRLMGSLWLFPFYVAANIVCTIAIDRLRNVCLILTYDATLRTTKMVTRSKTCKNYKYFVKRLLTASWLSGALWSVPQLFIWRTVELSPGWHQCVTVWDQRRAVQLLATNVFIDHRFPWETVYMTAHLLLIFWLPLTVIVYCYMVITVKLLRQTGSSFISTPTLKAAYLVSRPEISQMRQSKTEPDIRVIFRKTSNETVRKCSRLPNESSGAENFGKSVEQTAKIVSVFVETTLNEDQGLKKDKLNMVKAKSEVNLHPNVLYQKHQFKSETDLDCFQEVQIITSEIKPSSQKIHDTVTLVKVLVLDAELEQESPGNHRKTVVATNDETTVGEEKQTIFGDATRRFTDTGMATVIKQRTEIVRLVTETTSEQGQTVSESFLNEPSEKYTGSKLTDAPGTAQIEKITTESSSPTFTPTAIINFSEKLIKEKAKLTGAQSATPLLLTPRIPNWHGHVRTKIFKTAVLVVLAFVITWIPYNVSALVSLFHANTISKAFVNHFHWLKGLMLINAVINPYLYQFGRR